MASPTPYQRLRAKTQLTEELQRPRRELQEGLAHARTMSKMMPTSATNGTKPSNPAEAAAGLTVLGALTGGREASKWYSKITRK